MKIKLRLFVVIIILAILPGRYSLTIQAYEQENSTIEMVRSINGTFLNGYRDIYEIESPVNSSIGVCRLIDYYSSNGECIGYTILIDDAVVEFAESISPYQKALEVIDTYDDFYYDYSVYGITLGEYKYCIDINGNILYKTDLYGNALSFDMPDDNIWNRGTIPGVSPQLQGGFNCIVAALGNVIWYWGNHGFSALVSGVSMYNIMTELTNYFLNNGGYMNNLVPSVASMYAYYKTLGSVHYSGTVYWNPTNTLLVSEINSGYPCMLGYAAGPTPYTYSSTAGHMTMCYGYYYSPTGNLYVQLADGWNSTMVTRMWNSYNDCIISAHFY